MARLWTDGFEMKDVVGYTIGGTPAISTAVKRSGLASVFLDIAADTIQPPAFASIAEGYFRVAWYYNQATNACTIATWRSVAVVLGSIRMDADGKLGLYTGTTLRATGTQVLAGSTWYLIEVHVIINDAGTLEARVDGGAIDVTYSGDTKPGAETGFTNILFTGNASQNCYLDDLAINNTTGVADSSWCGDGHIISILPDGTIAHQLMGSDADDTDNHLLVDEIPSDGDTTYVEGDVADEEDLYSFAACGLAVDSVISRIWAEARAKDTVANGGTMALITKAAGGAEVSGGDVALLTTYGVRVMSAEELVNPVDTSAWEVADIDALQAGPRTRS